MIKEIPILFSTAMVQAIMEGRKTVTRRTVKRTALKWLEQDGFTPEFVADRENGLCPYGNVGDVLYVRESWQHTGLYYIFKITPSGKLNSDYWLDDEYVETDEKVKWKPSIHMPKVAARIWLEVTGVRVERLQEIKAADVSAEGIKYPVVPKDENRASPVFRITDPNGAIHFMPPDWQKMPDADMGNALLYAHFAELWCEINSRESWDSNPWVWVIEFKVLSTTGKPDSIPPDERSVATKLDQGKES